MTRCAACTILIVIAACKAKHAAHDDAAAPRPSPAGDAAATNLWPELANLPVVDAERVVALPVDAKQPRGDTGGPALVAGMAVVSSSQLGFVGVDVARGQVVWKKPGVGRVAPPVAVGDGFALLADCEHPGRGTRHSRAVGCLRIVSATGTDRDYMTVHGPTDDAVPFIEDPGAQKVWTRDERTIIWKRGDHALTVDTITGEAAATSAADPALVIHHKTKTWTITRAEDGTIVAKGDPPWRTQRPYSTLLGAVYLPEQSPMVRVANAGHYGGAPELLLFDIDATGSLHGQVSRPVPGVAIVDHAIDAVGDTALAVRLDASLARDFIAGYAANALIMWVYPLPIRARVDPIGVAIAPGVVVAFHDGDTLTILPELSAPPTAPGAARPPSEITTP
jgi:hypothetical protein